MPRLHVPFPIAVFLVLAVVPLELPAASPRLHARSARFQALHRLPPSSELHALYGVELNGDQGIDLPPGIRALPGGEISVHCSDPPAMVELVNQLGYSDPGRGVVGAFGLVCGHGTQTPDPVTVYQHLFEGRTQVITVLHDGSGEPALGPVVFRQGPDAGSPIMFDTDTGPPGHPELDTTPSEAFQSSNPAIERDLAGRRVVFDEEASADPMDLTIQGRVRNLPQTGGRLGEVGATVSVSIREIHGGSIAPLVSPVTAFTGPLPIAYGTDPVANPENASHDGMADAPGAFRVPLDFSQVASGTYELRFSARDVRGNASPDEGEDLVVQVVIERD